MLVGLLFVPLISAYQLFPNLGLVLIPDENVYTFDSFAHVKTSLRLEFKAVEYFDKNFDKTCQLTRSEETTNVKAKITEERETNRKFKNEKLAEHFYKEVMGKLLGYKIVLDPNSQITSTLKHFTADEIFSRDQRSLDMVLATMGGGAVGFGISWLIHKVFGLGQGHEIKQLRSDFVNVEKIRSFQIQQIEKEMVILNCKINNDMVDQFENWVKLIVQKEIERIDQIMLSIKYRIGFTPGIYRMIHGGCMLSVQDQTLCDEIIRLEKFVLNVSHVKLSLLTLDLAVDLVFPHELRNLPAINLYNYGILANNSNVGKRISTLGNINIISKNPLIGFNRNDCTTMDNLLLCSSEKISPNNLYENNCLKSILENSTENCGIENFQIFRKCYIHHIQERLFISSAANYILLKTVGTKIIRSQGKPGLYPVPAEKELTMVTLVCGNITRILEVRPLIIDSPTIINDEPSIFDPDIKFNISSIFNSNFEMNDLIESILDSPITKNLKTKDVFFIMIIFFLIIILIILIVLYKKCQNICTKMRNIDIN